MPRFDRLTFPERGSNASGDGAKPHSQRRGQSTPPSRLQFYWLRDDQDREAWLNSLSGHVEWIESRALIEDDPAPPLSAAVRQGSARVALISSPKDVSRALWDTDSFSNAPYAELGGASFMLAIDPQKEQDPDDWHGAQRKVASHVLNAFNEPALAAAARTACAQAALLSLRAPAFDMAEWAEQAALRYFGLLFGFGAGDHALLEDAARTGYRALQYLIVGRHFVSEPGTLPGAQQAMRRLTTRCSALMDEYAWRALSPRTPLLPSTTSHPAATWPDGVQPFAELALSQLGDPVLRRLPEQALLFAKSDTRPGKAARSLNDQDLCNLVAGLLVGTVGNVQTALCQMVQKLLNDPGRLARIKVSNVDALGGDVAALLAECPPVPFLPRRTRVDVLLNGVDVPAGTDCILALRAPSGGQAGCPHVWGALPPDYQDGTATSHLPQPPTARHACIGQRFIEPLLRVLLHQTVHLPGLEQTLDARTGEVLEPERLWGMGVMRYPLRHDRESRRVQQPLIVVMRVKSPIAEHAARLRQVIRCGVPRIESALDDSRFVHFAWFEFMENDSLLALRTVYDGDFDAYIEHFAFKTGDLFDLLFQSLEDAPPMPVAEHPHAFVEAIRRFNRTPLGGYFYSAYPRTTTALVRGRCVQ